MGIELDISAFLKVVNNTFLWKKQRAKAIAVLQERVKSLRNSILQCP